MILLIIALMIAVMPRERRYRVCNELATADGPNLAISEDELQK